MHHFLSRWLKNLPILLTGSLVTILLGSVVWLVLDNIQSKEVKKLLNHDIERSLDNELSEARIRLNNSIDDYIKFTYILSKHIENFHLSLNQTKPSNSKDQTHAVNSNPDWGLENEFWNYHSTIDYVLLFNKQKQVYETLNRTLTTTSFNSHNIDPYLIDISLDTSYMLMIEDKPSIISSRIVLINGNEHYLMIIKFIDNQFLFESQKSALSQGKIVAVFDNESFKVIASTSPKALVQISTVDTLTQQYKIAGKEYFDYGNSELELQFALLIPNNLYQALNLELIDLDRQNRLIIILVMSIMTFIGLLLFTRSISQLVSKVNDHSNKTFHSVKKQKTTGNELRYLNKIFDRFALRALSDKQIEEQRFTSNARSLQLSVLGGITSELNVGVIMREDKKFRPYNTIMEQYIQECGRLQLFIKHSDKNEINVMDCYHKRRIFKRSLIYLDSGARAIIIQDITEVSLHSEELKAMALHDPLTGLPNRTLLNDRIQSGIKLSKRESKPCLLLLMDLNRFKNVNDTLGHNIGDELLKQVSKRMASEIRNTDTLSRIGGDEFAILLVNSESEYSKTIALKLKNIISLPFNIMNNKIEIGISIGIASIDNAHNTEELLSHADIAMYHAKREHLDYSFYSHDIDPGYSDRSMIIDSIRSALDNNEFELYYQPQINPNDNSYIGFEALARWQHPKLGFLAPDFFISLAEENGYINELTQALFAKAIAQSQQWLEQGYRINLSFNLSAANLQDLSLLPFIRNTIKHSSVDAKLLTLEITESMLMQDQTAILEKLHEIKQLGMRLSIDDFGTGYSSLAYLRHMPVDELKIDRSFISDIDNIDSDLKLVRSIVDLAHNLELTIVAEGVETKFQKQVLSDLNCEHLQGYFYSKPMPAEQVTEWIKNNTAIKPL